MKLSFRAARVAVAMSLCAAAAIGCSAEPAPVESDPAAAAPADPAAVQTSFDSYVTAALSRDGVAAADFIAHDTHEYYGALRDDALALPSGDLAGRTGADQLTIMILRAEVEAEALRALEVDEVLVKAFDLGLIDESTYDDVQIDDISVNGSTAVADLVKGENRLEGGFVFRFEDQMWKLDLMPMIDKGNAGFLAFAEQEGLTLNEFVDRLVEAKYGAGAVAELREPLT